VKNVSKIKWSTNLIPFSPCGDRFCLGYKRQYTIEEKIKAVSKIEGLQGVELHYPTMVNDKNVGKVKKILSDANLVCSLVTPSLSGEAKWMRGALTNSDKKLREEAVDRVKRAIDISRELKANKINLWLGQDGYDYSFQTDYIEKWDMLIDAVKVCAMYNKDVKICLEYKLKEPRTHVFMGTVGKILFLIDMVNEENVGGNIDVGHALMAFENPAESVLLLYRKGKLFHIHLNDNYGDWDWDMIVGTNHVMEFIELIFWLDEIGYSGWYSFDQYPSRENSIKSIELSIKNLESLKMVVSKLDRSIIRAALKKGDYVTLLEAIRSAMEDF